MARERFTKSVTVIGKAEIETAKLEGRKMAALARSESGRAFDCEVIMPPVLPGDSVTGQAFEIQFDWKWSKKKQMANLANEFVFHAYVIGALDPALATVLSNIVQEHGLFEHSIGEFFLLYGRFEQRYGASKGTRALQVMKELVGGDAKYLKDYRYRGRLERVPLPYAVRNILAHKNNTNQLDSRGDDIRISIDLLKEWVQKA